jgi:pimeloyl-ACP methyl ester carboxylesterase
MQLEIIHTKPHSTSLGTIVLLHGVCFGAWYWETNFQPWFTTNGYEVISISYRNHGNSEKKGSLKWRSIKEYVEDVHSIVSAIQGNIYLIGHSMGGFIVQHYLQKHPSPQIKKATLLCTVPASGIGGATFQIIKHYPVRFFMALFTLSFLPVFNNEQRAKHLMFSKHFSDDTLHSFFPRMQDESFKAYLDMLLLHLPSINNTGVPLLMIAGADDFLISTSSVEKNAKQLGAAFEIVEGGHNINWEAGWEDLAEKIKDFFK